ncbi:Rieske 2Fe-2S domain-containing protein [Pseudonocardia hispaniensis]|uniref:Rieske 2Fe-2S domain-containing protein n=1 Tax=Pseudonocardia hispaniensis TaxID=904933 RepID=A0ABW1J4P5_9PSEU
MSLTNSMDVGSAVGKVSKRQYEPYLKASWGLLNHWYPALFSSELGENEVKGVTICGVPLILRRVHGKVHVLRDQCVHRGVKMSIRPMCLTDDTITCWYHGYTYNLETGRLETIIAAPDDEIVGTTGIQVFPVQEVNNLIYVFVGEPGYEPVPELRLDLPPKLENPVHPVAHPLDPDTMILGVRRTANANWRLGVENGFDPGHQMLHRDAAIVLARDTALPLGINPTDPRAITAYEDEDGPKGMMNEWNSGFYDLVMANERLNIKAAGNNPTVGLRTSMYLPGVLMVENWPAYGLAQYEWFVPIDDKTHEYWSVIAAKVSTEEERKRFQYDFDYLWRDQALIGFNADDVFAREAMENFYEEGGPGWDDEQLCGMDAIIVAWRKLVSRHAREIQKPQRNPSPKLAE